jgi:hypothetical protein
MLTVKLEDQGTPEPDKGVEFIAMKRGVLYTYGTGHDKAWLYMKVKHSIVGDCLLAISLHMRDDEALQICGATGGRYFQVRGIRRLTSTS